MNKFSLNKDLDQFTNTTYNEYIDVSSTSRSKKINAKDKSLKALNQTMMTERVKPRLLQ